MRSVIAEANEHVPIALVLRMLGTEVPEDLGARSSHKVRCPFGDVYHSDHGASPTMRVYTDSNSVFCFSCSTSYTPVRLAAKGLDLDARTAALRLLDRIGRAPLDLAARWRTAIEYEPEPDKAQLAEALKTYCRRIDPDWNTRQFEPAVATRLTHCLRVLDLVHTAEEASMWLTTCKQVMLVALETREPSERAN